MNGRVAWISIAPVKGLGLVACDAVDLSPEGVVENRRFHVVDERDRMVNGKRLGRLVQVRPAYDDGGGHLRLRFPDGTEAAGPVILGEPVTSLFYGRPRGGQEVLGPFSEALSAFAGTALRLVRTERPSNALDRGRGGSVSLVSSAALTGLDPRRFRMLLGVDGVAAHAEDDWVGHRVRVGGAVVRPTGHTGRCLVTSQHPDTGTPDMDMLQRIRDTRPDDTETALPFGVHGSVVRPGRVAVGDPVVPL
ncbi:MAG: MOSC domain-containing protein [Solirubrobacteraceae bacterium]